MEPAKRMINHPSKRHYPIRATKFELLEFIKKREFITSIDLVNHFKYLPQSAERKLRGLRYMGLITSWSSPEQYCLTQLGEKKYAYYVKKVGQENNQ